MDKQESNCKLANYNIVASELNKYPLIILRND